MLLARITLAVAALSLTGFGAWFLASPESSARMVEIIAATPTARTDFRATYGGLNLGVGMLIGLALVTSKLREGLIATAMVFGGYATGRAFGLAADQAPAPLLYQLLVIEIASTALALYALARLPEYTEKAPLSSRP